MMHSTVRPRRKIRSALAAVLNPEGVVIDSPITL